jgi:large subunit ribosomal protein L24
MKRIKKSDTVIVIAGKSKGQVGKVISVADTKVVVEGINMMKKHIKPNPQLEQKGGIIAKEAPLDISNIALYNPLTKKADKVGFKFIEKDGGKQKVRYFKSNNEVIDLV